MDRSRVSSQEFFPQATGPAVAPVRARLKWFNGPKGFGFVNPEDRPETDAFLHVTTLQKVGLHGLGEGAVMICDIEYGERGAHVRQIFEVIDPGTPSGGGTLKATHNACDPGRLYEMAGTVKWYKPEQGFGFITPDDGQKDVFVHKSCLDKQGLEILHPGQRVHMTFRSVPKGRETVELSVLDDR